MSDIKTAYTAEVALTITNLNSLASSATAGWQSAVIDNTSNLYLDALIQVVLNFASTTPANDRCAYIYAYAGLDTVYSNPASGSEGTITLQSVTSNAQNMRLIGRVEYTLIGEVAETSPMSVAAGFGGILPPKWGLAIINFSGAALEASGNNVSYRGVYSTVL